MNPTPIPTPNDLAVDPNRVTPGLLGFLSFVFLILTVVVIYFLLRRQLTRIDFDEGAMPAGVKPLPKYATKAERRKTALRLQKEREAAQQERSGEAAGAAAAAGAGDGGGSDVDDGPDVAGGRGEDGPDVAGDPSVEAEGAGAADGGSTAAQEDAGSRPNPASGGSDTTPPAQS